jgi:transposase-like protein
MVIRDVCPRCKSPKYKHNGHMHNEKQHHHYHDSGRQFVRDFEQYRIAEDKRTLIEHLLLEGMSLRGMCRTVGLKRKGLLGVLVQCIEALPDHLHVQPVTGHDNVMLRRLEVEGGSGSPWMPRGARSLPST